VTATVDDDNDGGTTAEVAVVNGSPVTVIFHGFESRSESTDQPNRSIGPEGDSIASLTVSVADPMTARMSKPLSAETMLEATQAAPKREQVVV
jgi:hypothetical protein